MIDNFSLGLTHVLLLYAAWRLIARPDLDNPDLDRKVSEDTPKRGWGRKRERG